MNSIELNPHISKKFIEDIALRGKQKIDVKYTQQFPCPKYYHRQATMRAQQTRAGDEGVTYFLRCLICGDRWTFS
jgi:DNA-directed RNA polymerase subunit M/transcription elongation factor TFIIS